MIMTPFGAAVVPEKYGRAATSSPGEMSMPGAGSDCAAIMSSTER